MDGQNRLTQKFRYFWWKKPSGQSQTLLRFNGSSQKLFKTSFARVCKQKLIIFILSEYSLIKVTSIKL